MAKSWQMCYIIRCDMVVTLQRPIDPSQLLSRQHAANLRERQVFCLLRGNMSVTLSGSQLCEQTCLHSPSALRWRPGTLAEGLFPSRKHTSTTRVKLCQTKPVNTDTQDSSATEALWVHVWESSRIGTAAASSLCTYSSLYLHKVCQLHYVI